jgi:preprotein translocase subunit SecF
MEFFRIKKDIPFMRHALIFNLISFATFALAVFFLITKGLHLSVEFTGGTVMEVKYEQAAPIDNIRTKINSLGYEDVQVQNFGSSHDVMIRVPLQKDKQGNAISSSTQSQMIFKELQTLPNLGNNSAKLVRTDFVGPQIGKELASGGLKALAFVIFGIVAYLSFRFEWKFAIAGIIANLHDVVIILGFFSFFGWEFSLSVLAAILAILGYSVNESVVIFDRIRENFKKYRKYTTIEVINNAITSTISRTIITHGCTQLMVLGMLFLGGPSLYYFALALTIGICFGIYSSVFVAASIAMWLGVKREDLIKAPKEGGTEIIDFDKSDPNFGSKV